MNEDKDFEIKVFDILKGSQDGTFKKGDHISFLKDGAILCKEARGWITKEEVKDATKGMVYGLTDASIEKILTDIQKNISKLNKLTEYINNLKSKPPEERR